MKITFEIRKIIGKISQVLSPGYGTCFRCGRTWNSCKWHTTLITSRTGCFPLCEDCWTELTPETRLPFYKELWYSWQSGGRTSDNGRSWEETWDLIENAVRKGQ